VYERNDTTVSTKVNGNLVNWTTGPKIGNGLFGDVIWAMDCNTGEIFAVKRLDMYKNNNELNREVVESLKSEIEVLKNHTHPNIVWYVGSEIIDK
jgi:leucyl aminopeptidase (aminopeptidase T)